MLRRSVLSFSLAAIAALTLPAGDAPAQTWPSRPIHIIVPFPPGGANDVLGRLFAERMQVALGQPVVVENKPGAGGNIGTEFVAKQPGDGYALLLSAGPLANVNFFAKMPYNPIKDFEPISLVATIPFVLTVNAARPVNNMKEFIAYVKANPGSTYATAGIGTPQHLGAELLKTMTGANFVHVPYKGGAFILPALLANEVVFSIHSVAALVPHFKSGKLRPIAMASETRSPLMPEVPTMDEAGPLPGYGIEVWFGVLAPAGTPRAVIDRLNTIINGVVRDPQTAKDRLNPVGLSGVGTTPEQFMNVMKSDLVKYAKITKDAGIKPE